MKDRQDLPELAKSYLFTIKITFDNILPDKAEEFAYDKFDTNQERLVKTIGVKCKHGH